MFKRSWSLFGSLPLALLSGAAYGQDTIALVESPGPEWQRQTVEVRCGDNVLAVALEIDGLGRAKFAETTVNGDPSRIDQQTVIEQYLAKVGGATLQVGRCHSSLSLSIGILGSRFDTPPGEEDDVVELFLLTFDDP